MKFDIGLGYGNYSSCNFLKEEVLVGDIIYITFEPINVLKWKRRGKKKKNEIHRLGLRISWNLHMTTLCRIYYLERLMDISLFRHEKVLRDCSLNKTERIKSAAYVKFSKYSENFGWLAIIYPVIIFVVILKSICLLNAPLLVINIKWTNKEKSHNLIIE